MLVVLKSGKTITTKGDTPFLMENGLYRFNKLVNFDSAWAPRHQIIEITDDPLIPQINIEYMTIDKDGSTTKPHHQDDGTERRCKV